MYLFLKKRPVKDKIGENWKDSISWGYLSFRGTKLTPSTQCHLFPILIFSLFLRKFHSVKPFNGNFCEPGRARFAEEKMEFPSQVVSKTYSILFSAKFGPFSNSFRGRARSTCGMNLFMSWLV